MGYLIGVVSLRFSVKSAAITEFVMADNVLNPFSDEAAASRAGFDS